MGVSVNAVRGVADGPLAVVLSGGGARAAYQVGVLAAIAESFPELPVPIVTGVSAGAINAVYLAGHAGPFRQAVDGLRAEWQQLTPDRVYSVPTFRFGRSLIRWTLDMLFRRRTGPPALRGVMDMDPLREFLRECVKFDAIQRNIEQESLRAIALSATCYGTGQTVTFVQGAGDVPTWQRHMRVAVRTPLTIDHLMASVAIPIIFPAVRVGDAFYGDGSVRQTAPLAPAIHLGARRVLAIAMRTGRASETCSVEEQREYPVAAEVLGTLLHSVFLDSLDADAERLLRINQLLEQVPSDARPTGNQLKPVGLRLVRPSRDVGALARSYAPRLPRLVRLLLRSLGGERARASDFLSYMMFQPEYTKVLMELGYEDTRAHWGELESFLAGTRQGVKGEE